MYSVIHPEQKSQRIRPEKNRAEFLEEGVEFLRDVWRFPSLKEFERVHIFSKDDRESYILAPGENLYEVLAEIWKDPGDYYYSPHIYLHGRQRTEERIVQLNAIVIDLDNADIDASLESLAKVGIKPHYIVYTSYGHFQLVIKEESIRFRLGKKNRATILARQRKLIRKLYRLTGGDMQAAKANQLFRLPGSRRETDYGIWTVAVPEKYDHPAYPIKDLEQAVGISRATFKGYRRLSFSTGGAVCSSPAIRWIMTHTIREGFRNAAVVALAYACAMDNQPLESALSGILGWVRDHTQGPYPEREARQTIRSCYSNPKGLDWQRLMELETVDGQRMSVDEAKSVLKSMPSVKQQHEPLPLHELKNKPGFITLGKVLDTILALQRANHNRPVAISAEELAQRANVPKGTLENRLTAALNAMGIRTTTRKGRSTIAVYDIRRLNRGKLINTPYAFMESIKFARSFNRVLTYWAVRFTKWWWAFRQTLLALLAYIETTLLRSTAKSTLRKQNACGQRYIHARYRAPPWPAAG